MLPWALRGRESSSYSAVRAFMLSTNPLGMSPRRSTKVCARDMYFANVLYIDLKHNTFPTRADITVQSVIIDMTYTFVFVGHCHVECVAGNVNHIFTRYLKPSQILGKLCQACKTNHTHATENDFERSVHTCSLATHHAWTERKS